MNSSGSWRLDFGSNTSRTGCSLSDSSRTRSSSDSIRLFRFCCSWVSAFLPDFSFGLVASSISASTFCALEPGGSWLTMMRHWPRASFSTSHLARTRTLPRPTS
ncbi:hypothetical protein D3C85_1404980 [compost metagenome]